MEKHFELALVEQCAPTLACLKPANLFRFSGAQPKEIRRWAEEWNLQLEPSGICVAVLKECPASGACMLYVYRRGWVERILWERENLEFLSRMGYHAAAAEGMLAQLSERLCIEAEYPHEVGLFLGYPLQDVVGFIENRGWNYTCCGYWKSYGDPEEARRCFARYRRCTAIYQNLYRRGTPVMDLVVAA